MNPPISGVFFFLLPLVVQKKKNAWSQVRLFRVNMINKLMAAVAPAIGSVWYHKIPKRQTTFMKIVDVSL